MHLWPDVWWLRSRRWGRTLCEHRCGLSEGLSPDELRRMRRAGATVDELLDARRRHVALQGYLIARTAGATHPEAVGAYWACLVLPEYAAARGLGYSHVELMALTDRTPQTVGRLAALASRHPSRTLARELSEVHRRWGPAIFCSYVMGRYCAVGHARARALATRGMVAGELATWVVAAAALEASLATLPGAEAPLAEAIATFVPTFEALGGLWADDLAAAAVACCTELTAASGAGDEPVP